MHAVHFDWEIHTDCCISHLAPLNNAVISPAFLTVAVVPSLLVSCSIFCIVLLCWLVDLKSALPCLSHQNGSVVSERCQSQNCSYFRVLGQWLNRAIPVPEDRAAHYHVHSHYTMTKMPLSQQVHAASDRVPWSFSPADLGLRLSFIIW